MTPSMMLRHVTDAVALAREQRHSADRDDGDHRDPEKADRGVSEKRLGDSLSGGFSPQMPRSPSRSPSHGADVSFRPRLGRSPV